MKDEPMPPPEDITSAQMDPLQDTDRMTPPREPQTPEGRELLDLIYNPDSSYSERMVIRAINKIEAAGAPLREELADRFHHLLSVEAGIQRADELRAEIEAEIRYADAAITAREPAPAPHTLADCRDAVEQHTGAAPYKPAPTPLDVEALPDALAIVFADLENTPGRVFGSYWQDRADALLTALAEIASEAARLTARAAGQATPSKATEPHIKKGERMVRAYDQFFRAAATEDKS